MDGVTLSFLGFGLFWVVCGVYDWGWFLEMLMSSTPRQDRPTPPVIWTPFKRACARILAVLMGFCLVAAGVYRMVLLLQGIPV